MSCGVDGGGGDADDDDDAHRSQSDSATAAETAAPAKPTHGTIPVLNAPTQIHSAGIDCVEVVLLLLLLGSISSAAQLQST